LSSNISISRLLFVFITVVSITGTTIPAIGSQPLQSSAANVSQMVKQIAEERQAIDEVYYGVKEPKEALDDAAAKSALILGW
jgi:phosphatidylserine/phosphatidylglycerophosphate/cardiolipin synthase-like enzyme